MNKYISISRMNIVYLLVFSILISMLFTYIYFSGLNIISDLEPKIFADKEDAFNVNNVVVVEERIIPVIKEVEVEVIEQPLTMTLLGGFNLTAYCPCKSCCDQWGAAPEGKIGSLGVGVYEGITFAVDPRIIPYGTKIYIEGVGVGIATDCGGAIKGNRIDVYFASHTEARKFGIAGGYPHNVYIIED